MRGIRISGFLDFTWISRISTMGVQDFCLVIDPSGDATVYMLIHAFVCATGMGPQESWHQTTINTLANVFLLFI